MLSVNDVTNAINRVGIAAFGIGMPVLSPNWTKNPEAVSEALQEAVNGSLSLTLIRDLPEPPNHSWLCPAAGVLRKVDETPEEGFTNLGVTLLRADGNPIRERGMLLTLFPQVYLRLRRLYARLLEQNPSELGQPIRPVPQYFFYAGNPGRDAKSGNVNPGDSLEILGTLTIHDENGMPIDPIAVAAVFYAFIRKYPILQKSPDLSTPDLEGSQLKRIVDNAGAAAVRLFLSHHSGQPYTNTEGRIEGITPVEGTPGLFTLNPSVTALTLAAVDESFTAEARRLLVLGFANDGQLGDRVSIPSLPDGVTLRRDFLSIRVVELQSFLLGSRDRPFPDAGLEIAPTVHTQEPLQLLADGNDVLAAAHQAIDGSEESLCVGQAIDGDFTIPTEPGENARFPNFPLPSTGIDATDNLRVDLRDRLNPTAVFIDDNEDATLNVDVNLTLSNLPVNASVRVYPRQFDIATADAQRGDGAGGIVPSDGRLTLLLRDPLGIRRPNLPEPRTFAPDDATLYCDIVVVQRNGQSRIYGGITVPIQRPVPTSPPNLGSNNLGTATRRSICRAGILGTGSRISVPDDNTIAAALALTQEPTEGNPTRDASRLPTMARRDVLVAGRRDRQWKAVLSAGRLTPEMLSSQPRLGNPGSSGGRETQHVGVASQGGRLAYEIARMALRRVANLGDRLPLLATTNWTPPSALEPEDDGAGTFAGAVLQTIAPHCETPGLRLLRDNRVDLNGMPTAYEELRAWLQRQFEAIAPETTPGRTQISQILTTLTNLGDALSDDIKELLAIEIRREIVSSCYGRRDTQWVLKEAIAKARRFIYIETPGLAATQVDAGESFSADLFGILRERLNEAPGLHVIISTPKFPDFPKNDRIYQGMANWEVNDRRRAINERLNVTDSTNPRVVAFHPIGFPGRFSRLEGTVVIVDDVWALVGSSSFRRRGLTFDGSSDLVLTDMVLRKGCCAAIADFRRTLLAHRLGIDRSTTNSFGKMPNANFVRLEDGVETFYVVQEMLQAGGLGKIAPLWSETYTEGQMIPVQFSNPEGQSFTWSAEVRSQLVPDLLPPFEWLY